MSVSYGVIWHNWNYSIPTSILRITIRTLVSTILKGFIWHYMICHCMYSVETLFFYAYNIILHRQNLSILASILVLLTSTMKDILFQISLVHPLSIWVFLLHPPFPSLAYFLLYCTSSQTKLQGHIIKLSPWLILCCCLRVCTWSCAMNFGREVLMQSSRPSYQN